MKKLIIYILAVFSAGVSYALPLEQLSSVAGMTNNKINAIHRDSDGFMWFATVAGLCRYDGYDHDLYFIHRSPDGMPEGENDIDNITEAADGRLWLRSHTMYYVYNPLTECIEHNADSLFHAYGGQGYVRMVKADKNKALWIYAESPSGIYYVEPERNRARKISTLGYRELERDEVTDFAGTPHGMAVVTRRGSIYLVSPSACEVTERINDICVENSAIPDMVYTMMYDRDGLLWVYNTERLWVLDLPRRRWLNHRLPQEGRGMIVKSVAQDNDGRVWLGRDHHGLELVSKHSDRIDFHEMLDSANLSESSSVTTVCDDGSGTLWLGTYKRGVFYHNDTMHKFSLAKGSDVNCLVPRSDGKVWVGSDSRSVGVFDPSDASVTYFQSVGSSAAVTSMLPARDGTLYVGTFSRGLQRMRGHDTERIVTHTPIDSVYTWALANGPDGDIWIGSLESGLFRYNPSRGLVAEYNTLNGLPSDCILALATAPDSTLYVATAYGVGMIHNGAARAEILEGFDPGTMIDITVDSRGLVWVASHRGIKVYDPHFRRIHDIEVKGRKGASYVIGLQEDKEGGIWAAEGGRLIHIQVKYDSDSGLITTTDRSYDSRDGLQDSDFNQRSLALLPSGEMLVGGLYGINYFDPAKIRLNNLAPRVMFTSLRVDGSQVTPGQKSRGRVVTDRAINRSRKIDLSHDFRDITVNFATDNYVLPEKTVYSYKLDGFNDDWQSTEPGVNHVTYTNLSPGRYTLLVKARNNDGFESEDTAALEIVVHEPFYWTVWARLAYMVMVLGAIYGVYVIIRQRERRRFNEKRRADALKKEEEVNQMKLRFITNISHDLRTPLTLIMSPLDTMLKEGGDERHMKRLALMRKNADQLLAMVNQLLDFRKSEMSGLTLKASDGELVAFLENVCSSFNGLSISGGIKLRFTSDIHALYMRYDEQKIYKVMTNLIGNALKFTPSGGSVTIGIRLKDEGNVIISVSDTGPGVSDEDKRHIFERFYQSKEAASDPATTGYGIGLSLVHDYVELHGGHVEVSDNTPTGAVFEITLPVVECEKPPVTLPEPAPASAQASAAIAQMLDEPRRTRPAEPVAKPQARPTALVVDDNADMLEFLKDGLGRDFHVVTVGSGSEALRLLGSLKPSIIITDLMMPGVDGVELTRRIKADKELGNIPVIVLSAKSGEDAKVEMLTLGVEDYITKPFNIELLILRMKRLVALTSGTRGSRLIDPEPESIPITPLDEKMVEKAVKYVVSNMKRSELSVEELSSHLGMSRVHLYKKLKTTTGKTPIEFIRLIRLKRAAQLLRESQLNVSEVAYQVGFNSPRNFSKYFRDEFGMLPSAYQETKEQATIRPL